MSNKKIVVGITGSIAAYKSAELISNLVQQQIEVFPVMTENAKKFITPLTLGILAGNKTRDNLFNEEESKVSHIELAQGIDLIVISPATANIIGKMANGIADDLLSTILMAANCPIILAPAMNNVMYKNKIVQQNIKKLKDLGTIFIEPEEGFLACRKEGKGRLANIDKIIEVINENLYSKNNLKQLSNLKILITAGPTREKIDPVRYLSNFSSGKMGYSLASEAQKQGAQVTLISGPTELLKPDNIKIISVETTEEMYNNVKIFFNNSDIIFMVAAVLDFKPKKYFKEKIKKQETLNLQLIKNVDILKELSKVKKNQIVVGFAAETNNLINNAKEKLKEKNLDVIIANEVGKNKAIGQEENKVTIILKNGKIFNLPKMKKAKLASKILNIIKNELIVNDYTDGSKVIIHK